ncbi:hypothetical protein [Bosea sp. 685]|uniref:hypothetical protein n=1 Tax=Bosea sp. 685 TaxID=3080057 RepID=UPI002892A2CA|nr:hypothetical protein [Bosea sp. 685]WNJ91769.1 hypothetical protein RMR04_05535 [Bosea sp. 685]
MEYHQETLDRPTGRLETKSIGNWITITELGAGYGVGPRTTRLVLHHMGVLAQEGQRYRLPRDLVEDGIGLRHDRPKSGHPFDVISPVGQNLIATVWAEAAADYAVKSQRVEHVQMIRDALALFKETRLTPLDTRQETYWVLDHFPNLQHQTLATALEVSPALVSRYVKQRSAKRDALRWRRDKPVRWMSREIKDKILMSGLGGNAPYETTCMSPGERPNDGYITEGLYTPENDQPYQKPNKPGFSVVDLLRYAPTLYRMSPTQRHVRVWQVHKPDQDVDAVVEAGSNRP